jgi:peptidyl-prolyl cis-trans isomerase SurA
MVLTAMIASGLLAQESPVLLTIADEQVTLAEFERIYRKNNNEASLNRQTPDEYLDLFINFKLKVKEAEALGMDTTAKFINELEGYRVQLAKPYLTDDETKEIMIQEAYERSKLDINASHILIKLPEFATPEDTLAAYIKITEIRGRILSGEDFETVAKATSEDQSVNRNGGNLGYFTAFAMIYSFETIAYNTSVGEISMPFRTNYGYHILLIHDKRPARGQVKVAHIFVRNPEGMSEEQKKEAYEKTQMIYDSLQMGTDFAYMARTYSEDPSSAQNGGETPWFGTGRMFPEFEDACFSIEEIGTYDKPFKSMLGWHIIKLLDKKGIGTYEEMEPELQEKINRGDRGQHKTNRYISKLKIEHGFSEYPEALETVYSSVDTSLLSGNWDGGDLIDNTTPLMKIGDRMATTGEFVAFITTNQNTGKSRDPIGYVDRLYEQFSQDAVMKYEESKLPEKYPEFRYIYQEYHDGILLFDIMDQRVWSKAVSDTIGLAAYHQEHRDNYMWQSRSEAYLITSGKDVNLTGVRKVYKKILKGKVDEAFLNSSLCPNDTIPCITLTLLLVEEGKNELVDDMKGQPGLGPVVESEETKSFVILKKMRSPEPKKLNESRGQITSDYQNYLEKEWIKELKQKYPVEVDNSLLSRINM